MSRLLMFIGYLMGAQQMTKTKPNGDIYVLGIRTYSGAAKRPVRWVYGTMVALFTACFYVGVYGVLSVNI